MVGRFDPFKDIRGFIETAGLLRQQFPQARFVLCGNGIEWENAELVSWIKAAGIGSVSHLLGRRDDIPRIMATLDIAVSSSIGEGFSNVIGEAMACGVPCVVTDVGDSAMIVGDTGRVVPRRDPKALAKACEQLLEMEPERRTELGSLARDRILTNFRLPNIIRRYEQFYEGLAADVRN